ncbi:hypothetical protein DL769_001339 [Monosporascus sp. CRB-8-3]|nr:hypothetical protein DL769_001339 [Monosporascus sp. CRB-8-3]
MVSLDNEVTFDENQLASFTPREAGKGLGYRRARVAVCGNNNATVRLIAWKECIESEKYTPGFATCNLGPDSLIAIEIKNWILSTLQAPTQVGGILGSANLRALASLVTERSGLVEKTDKMAGVNGHQPAPEAITNGQVVNGKSPKKP